MTIGSHTRACEIFNDALDLADAERDAFIAAACRGDETLRAEVTSLLAVHDDAAGTDFLDAPEIDVLSPMADRVLASASLVGQRIGPYKVLDLIGEGGMGVVYRAQQGQPRRIVALKVLRPGLLSRRMLRRFELEAEMLGRLQHPGIAQIFEAGTADTPSGPQPYFAMELVSGRPLLEYTEAEGLDTTARLELIARICEAVQHAHQQGIVHRDLKPGNILVDSTGRPRVLDFGVARATDSDATIATLHTSARDLVGTLQYMSPEQCDADPSRLDTRSDVYSLGVVCYELLAGEPPYSVADKPLPLALAEIREAEPRPLSSVNRVFKGDIDTIVNKAMEKDPRRRYQSASELAADIRRFLGHEPIAARRPSTVYHIGRFVRRNRILVGGVAATIIALAGGLVVAGLQARAAHDEARKRGVVMEFVGRNLGDTVGFLRRPEFEALLDDVAASLDFEMSPMTESNIRGHIAIIYVVGGRYAKAEPHLRRHLELQLAMWGPGQSQPLRAVQMLGDALNGVGRFQEAEHLLRGTIDGIDAPTLSTDRAIRFRVLRIRYTLARTLHGLGRLDEAEALYRETFAQQDIEARDNGLTPSDPIETMVGLAVLLCDRGVSLDEAESLLRDAVARRVEFSGRYDEHTLRVRWLLGKCLLLRGDLAEARSLLDEARAWYRDKKGDRHVMTVAVLLDFACLLHHEARPIEAAAVFDEAMSLAEQADLGAWRMDRLRRDYAACVEPGQS